MTECCEYGLYSSSLMHGVDGSTCHGFWPLPMAFPTLVPTGLMPLALQTVT